MLGVRKPYPRTGTSHWWSHCTRTPDVCDNYCCISLQSIPSQTIICRAILNCIKPCVEFQLRESQCGSRMGRGCVDQVFSFRVRMEKAQEYLCTYVSLTLERTTINRFCEQSCTVGGYPTHPQSSAETVCYHLCIS